MVAVWATIGIVGFFVLWGWFWWPEHGIMDRWADRLDARDKRREQEADHRGHDEHQ